MTALPTWLRRALYATAVMNIGGAIAFLPPATSLRAVAGLPVDGPPLYLATVGMFVLVFGLAYLWTAVRGCSEPLFMALAGGGKIAFFALLVWFWGVGDLPLRAPILGSADLVFGSLFLGWLLGGDLRSDPRALSS